MTLIENHTYSRGASIFNKAAESFGVPLDDGQLLEWKALIKTAFDLDSILDSDMPETEREAAFDRSVPELIYPLAGTWDSEKLNRVVSAAMNVKEIAAEKRAATSARKLGSLAIHEGLETKRFLQLQDSGDIGVASFNKWLEILLPFGVVIDTAVDLPEDYVNNLTRVRPTYLNRAILASYGARFTGGLIAATPPNLFKPLFNAARAVTQDSTKDMLSNS